MMGGSGGISIPYQRIEYLQGDGNSYIETDVPGNNDNLEIAIDCYIYSYNEGVYGNIYSSYNSTAIRIRRISGSNLFEKTLNTRNSSASGTDGITLAPFTENTRYSIVSTKQGVTINGIYYDSTEHSASNSNNARTIKLYTATYNYANISNMKCYSFSIKDNGTLILNFIPVRIGTTGYMYDTVSGELFGNVGTGDFTLGPDLVMGGGVST